MSNYIKYPPHTAIFTGPNGCGKGHLVLDLIEKEHNKDFAYIVIIYPKPQWNKIYRNKGWIRHDDNFYLVEPNKR